MSQASPPWLSVVMPTFDGEAFVGHALDSLVAETRDHPGQVEVIVVDDRSTDGTAELVASYADRLALTVHRRHGPRGWVAGTNEGMRMARGRYACFLHQDDLWLPGRLAAVMACLEANPEADLLISAASFIDAEGHTIGRWRCPLPSSETVDPALLFERLLIQNFIAIPAPVFRRRGLQLDEDLWYTADWDLWLRLARRGARVAYDAEPRVAFRIHPGSQTIERSVAGGELRRQLEAPLHRHALRATRAATRRAARFAVEVNVALAARAHGGAVDWGRLTVAGLRLGPEGAWRFARHARLGERVLPRLRLLRAARRAGHSR